MMRPMAKYYVVSVKTQPFSPLDLSPALWLDASDTTTITESSGAVSEWRDKSGNARHVSQGTAAAQPTTGSATLNGLNVLSFDSDDTMISASWALAQPFTVFLVFRTASDFASSSDTLYSALFDGDRAGNGSSGRAILFQRFIDKPAMGAGAGFVLPLSALTNSTVYSQVGIFDGASSKMRLNGTQANLASSPGTLGIAAGVAISNKSFGGGNFRDRVGEILVIPSVLSAADLANVETYLKNKWGIA